MALVYDFSNSDNWDLSWSGSRVAPDAPTDALNRYYPIEDFTIPIQFQSPIVAIYMTSNTDPGRWFRAGFAKQKISTGITVGGSPDAFADTKSLRLREVNLVNFNRLTTNYAITLSVPYWLRQISVITWEYTGIITDTTEELLLNCCQQLEQLINNNQQELNQSLDDILARLNSGSGGSSGNSPDGLTPPEQQYTAYFTGIL